MRYFIFLNYLIWIMINSLINHTMKEKHKDFLQKLIGMDLAFKEKNGPYRFKVDRANEYFQYDDLILGEVKIPSDNIEDFSIARSDGSPTFILTNIIDDFLEGVTHVIRGMITQLIQLNKN